MTILVTGGTGTLGTPLVSQLRAQGQQVRVLTRSQREGNDWVTGDLAKNTGLEAALSGISTVLHCATTLRKADIAATQHLADAAKHSGTPHLVYISIVGIDQLQSYPYYRTKRECERIVENSGLPWTILRATQFHDLLVMMFRLQRRLPFLIVPSKVSDQPISTADTARRLAELATAPAAGRVTDIGGPEVLGFDELAKAYLAATGRKRKAVRVSVPGKFGRGLRAGHLLTPDNRYGSETFAQHLAQLN